MQIEAVRVVFIESLNSFVINILKVRSDPANWSSLLSVAYKRGQLKVLGSKYIRSKVNQIAFFFEFLYCDLLKEYTTGALPLLSSLPAFSRIL